MADRRPPVRKAVGKAGEKAREVARARRAARLAAIAQQKLAEEERRKATRAGKDNSKAPRRRTAPDVLAGSGNQGNTDRVDHGTAGHIARSSAAETPAGAGASIDVERRRTVAEKATAKPSPGGFQAAKATQATCPTTPAGGTGHAPAAKSAVTSAATNANITTVTTNIGALDSTTRTLTGGLPAHSNTPGPRSPTSNNATGRSIDYRASPPSLPLQSYCTPYNPRSKL